jgi:hypothetical protein
MVVVRGARMSREIWLAFSVLAWPEFQRAIAQASNSYQRVEIVRRDFVPFRIPWLEPVPPEPGKDDTVFRERLRYYQQVLISRGLIDMDHHRPWPEYLRRFVALLPEDSGAVLRQQISQDLYCSQLTSRWN